MATPDELERTRAAVAVDPHPHWSEPAHDLRSRIHIGWIVSTWGFAALATVLLSAVAMGVLALTVDPFAQGRGSVSVIATGSSTMIAFVLVLWRRLPLLPDDRLLNSLGVAATHVAVAIAAFAVGAVLAAYGQTDWIPGDVDEEIGLIFVSLERSAAVVIVAALLVPGVIPGRGPVPAGTERDSDPGITGL